MALHGPRRALPAAASPTPTQPTHRARRLPDTGTPLPPIPHQTRTPPPPPAETGKCQPPVARGAATGRQLRPDTAGPSKPPYGGWESLVFMVPLQLCLSLGRLVQNPESRILPSRPPPYPPYLRPLPPTPYPPTSIGGRARSSPRSPPYWHPHGTRVPSLSAVPVGPPAGLHQRTPAPGAPSRGVGRRGRGLQGPLGGYHLRRHLPVPPPGRQTSRPAPGPACGRGRGAGLHSRGVRRVVCGDVRPGDARATTAPPAPPRGGRRPRLGVARGPRAHGGVVLAPQGARRVPRALTHVCGLRAALPLRPPCPPPPLLPRPPPPPQPGVQWCIADEDSNPPRESAISQRPQPLDW